MENDTFYLALVTPYTETPLRKIEPPNPGPCGRIHNHSLGNGYNYDEEWLSSIEDACIGIQEL